MGDKALLKHDIVQKINLELGYIKIGAMTLSITTFIIKALRIFGPLYNT